MPNKAIATTKIIDEFSIGSRLDNYLLKNLKGVPRSHIYSIVRKGEVRVNKGRKKVKYKLQKNDAVRIPPLRTSVRKPTNIPPNLQKLIQNNIIYEDAGLVIINKPGGLAVHAGSGIDTGVIEVLRHIYKNPVELVHRIDRATSGVLLLAKKRSVLKNLHAQLSQRKVEKRYTALVKDVWAKKTHTVDAPLYNNSKCSVVSVKGKVAISHFRPLKNYRTASFNASLVDIVIETGRTHQIRAHAKYMGHCIAYDDKYGDKVFNSQVKLKGLRRLFLHSYQFTFENPLTAKTQTVTAPLPEELEYFLTAL